MGGYDWVRVILSGGVGEVKSLSFLLPIWVDGIRVWVGSLAACDSCEGKDSYIGVRRV
jgi:hypothetical protein